MTDPASNPSIGERIGAASLSAEQAAELKARAYEIINAQSSAVSQNPEALDTPRQIEFGVNSIAGGSSAVTLDANGTLTFVDPGRYMIDISLQFGRLTGAGESIGITVFGIV